MSEFSISSAKLTGNPGASGWSQIHDFSPPEVEKLTSRGRLFAVIAVKGDEGEEEVETLNTGREILARLHEEYFGKTDVTVFNGLKRALEIVYKEFSGNLEGLEVGACVLLGDTVYSSACGGAEALVFRGGMVAPILKSTKDGVIAASGHPKTGDFLLLLTSPFAKSVSDVKLKETLKGATPERAVEEFAPLVHAKDDAGGAAAVVLQFGEKEEPVAVISPNTEGVEEETEGVVSEETAEELPEVSQPKPLTKRLSSFGAAFGRKLQERKLYIRKGEVDVEESRKKKTAFTVAALLLGILIVSIVFGIRQRAVNERVARYEPRLMEAQHQLEEARNLFSLNPERARELFSLSAQTVDSLIAEGVEDERLESLRTEIEKSRQEILGEFALETELFIDLSILADGLTADALIADSEYAYILDKTGRRIVEIALDTKRTEVIAGPTQIQDASGLASYAQRAFVLEDDGIIEVIDQRRTVIENDWEGDVLVHAYAGNMYVLDKGSSEILRHAGSDLAFGNGNNWLAPGITPDLSRVISWSIDGSIWILTSTGNIEKYTLGNSQPLDLSISPPLENPTKIYTNEELNYVYVLDPATSRLVVFDKDGNYRAQYKVGEAANASGLVVSEEEGKMILLVDKRLLSVEIRHL